MKFFFYRAGKRSGPFSVEQLKMLARDRTIGPETMLVSVTGHKGKAKQINGLFPEEEVTYKIEGGIHNPPYPGSGFSHGFSRMNADGGFTATSSPEGGFSSSFGNGLPPLDGGMGFVPNPPSCVYCTSCGQPLSPQAIACTNCGAFPSSGKKYCRNCGTSRRPKQIVCLKCGCSLRQTGSNGGGAGSPKSRIAAALFALLLGGIGIQKFYMGSWGWGIIFVVVGFMTFGTVTGIASLIDGIMWLCMSDDDFAAKYPPETEEPMRY